MGKNSSILVDPSDWDGLMSIAVMSYTYKEMSDEGKSIEITEGFSKYFNKAFVN